MRWWNGSDWEDPPAEAVIGEDDGGGGPSARSTGSRGPSGWLPRSPVFRVGLAAGGLVLAIVIAGIASETVFADDPRDSGPYRELTEANWACGQWSFLKLQSDILSYEEMRAELQEIYNSMYVVTWRTEVRGNVREVLAAFTHRDQRRYDAAVGQLDEACGDARKQMDDWRDEHL